MREIYLQTADGVTITTADLKIGNIFVREKNFGVKHYAVFSHFDSNGTPILAENQPETGTVYVSLTNFLAGGKLLDIQEFKGNVYFVRQQLNKLVGHKKYFLASYNCEHFVNEVTGRNVKSEQVNFIGETIATISSIALLLLLIFFLFKRLKRA